MNKVIPIPTWLPSNAELIDWRNRILEVANEVEPDERDEAALEAIEEELEKRDKIIRRSK